MSLNFVIIALAIEDTAVAIAVKARVLRTPLSIPIPAEAALAPILTFPVAFANPSSVAGAPFNPLKYSCVALSAFLMVSVCLSCVKASFLIASFQRFIIATCSSESPEFLSEDLNKEFIIPL